MVDIKKLATSGFLLLFSVFLYFTLSNAFIGTTIDSQQAVNGTLSDEGFTDQAAASDTSMGVINWVIVLTPLGLSIKSFLDAMELT